VIDTVALLPQDFPFELDGVAIHCVAKLNSLGCLPAIGATGRSSASAVAGFLVTGSNVRNNKPGLLIYSTTGPGALPFGGGVLCQMGPLKRTTAVSSGGSPLPMADCSGVYSIDMNAFAMGLLGGSPLPALIVPGTDVWCQWWGRDPGFPPPGNITLTDGLHYSVGL
jgi:hypothetical protein